MTYSIALVAHPSRSTLANSLGLQVNADALCWDVDGVGGEENHLAAWKYLSDGPDEWGVVLEDDIYVCRDFKAQLALVLNNAPSPVVSLYLGRGYPEDWQPRISAKIASDVCWLTAESLLSPQGYAIATTLIPDMLNTVTPLTDEMPIEEAISWWCQERGHLVSHCRPSIINHRDENPLREKKHATARTAWLFDWRDKWDDSTTHLTSLRSAPLPAD